jgi:PAS domain S-box-containing protein
MDIDKKIVVLVAFGMLSISAAAAASLYSVMTAFSSVDAEIKRTSREMQRIEALASELGDMEGGLRNFVAGGDAANRLTYEKARESAAAMLSSIRKSDLEPADRRLFDDVSANIDRIEEKTSRLFTLRDPSTLNRARAGALMSELRRLHERTAGDLKKRLNEGRSFQVSRPAEYYQFLKRRFMVVLGLLLLMSVGFLLGLGVFLHRKVVVPLNTLWNGATQISLGNLDYRMQMTGPSDIGQLAERFNEMSLQLHQSYGELEKKLLDRTNMLAAIDSVALTLSRAGSLKDVLNKSLAQVINSLAAMDPVGGVFLCEPDGEKLRLVAVHGLSPDFVRNEATIKMGECLCGIAAQTGEIIYAEKGCADPRHTRSRGEGDNAHIIIPIKSRGIVLGVMFLHPRMQFTLRPSDLQMLDTIGTQLGMAIENLRFYVEVKESSEKYWDLFENSRDILFTIDTAGTLTAVNKETEKFTGYSKTELVGMSILDFLTPEGVKTAKQLFRGDGATTRQLIEFEVVRRGGEHVFVEMSARKLYRNRLHVGFQVSARDMTEQKLMRKKLLEAERIGAISEVVITVRHEINNPLTTVIGNIELLLERLGDRDEELTKRLEVVLNNSLRIAEIVQKLQAIKRDKVVEYVKGVSMTDLKQE